MPDMNLADVNLAIALKLEYSTTPRRPAVAWWFDGPVLERWLSDVLDWPIRQSHCRILLVAGDQHGTIRGALFIPDHDSLARLTSIATLGVPFGRIDHLYLPVHARITAGDGSELRDEEIKPILDRNVEYRLAEFDGAERSDQDAARRDGLFWHPTAGLLACDASAVKRVADVLGFPEPTEADWSYARTGQAVNGRLVSIMPQATLDVAAILHDWGGEIGSQAEHLRDLPRGPNEHSFARILLSQFFLYLAMAVFVGAVVWFLAQVLGPEWWKALLALALVLGVAYGIFRLLRAGFSAVHSLLSSKFGRAGGRRAHAAGGAVAGGAAGSGWMRGLSQWLGGHVSRVSAQLEALRHREIERLLRLLDTSPDEGLRYALPMHSHASHRGIAPRGARLLQRLVDFSLRGGSSSPADCWNLDASHRDRLVQKYRELANREIALGRHRRAAYIFAELLGDFRQAAATLADGRHYREAAALYEQRLQDRMAAAKCLESGNLFLEAATIYQGFGQFEKVGEMYERADRPDLAEPAFRRAATWYAEQKDFLAAARIYETRLRHPNEAYRTLLTGWESSPPAAGCLHEAFQLLARLSDYKRARAEILRLAPKELGPTRAELLVACYAKLATRYPDATTRKLVADATRVLAARFLANPDSAGQDSSQQNSTRPRVFLDAVRQLVPEDRLLANDCRRFQNSRIPSRPAAAKRQMPLQKVGTMTLPEADWHAAVASQEQIFAIGFQGMGIVLARTSESSEEVQARTYSWPRDRLLGEGHDLLLLPQRLANARVLLHAWGCERFAAELVFPPLGDTGRRFLSGCRAFGPQTLAACRDPNGLLYVLDGQPPDLIVSVYNQTTNHLNWTSAITWKEIGFDFDEVLPTRFWPMVGMLGCCWIGIGRQLVRVASDGNAVAATLKSTVVALEPVHAPSSCVIATLAEGAVFWPGDPRSTGGIEFGMDLQHPRAASVGPEHIVLADEDRIELFRITDQRLLLVGGITEKRSRPIAVIPSADGTRVAIVEPNGRITSWNIG